jgi:hypothetical protein
MEPRLPGGERERDPERRVSTWPEKASRRMKVEPGQGTEEVVGEVSKSWRGSSARMVSGGVEGPTVESSGSGSMWLSFMVVVV